MKLYDLPPSPNALKVRLVLNHLNLPFEHELVDLPKGGHLQPAFVAMNPNAKMPVLEDDGFVLWESNAIILYLAEKHNSDLIPRNLQERAHMHKWLAWGLAHWTTTLGPWLFNTLAPSFFEGYVVDHDAIARSKQDFSKYATVLNSSLVGKDYLVGSGVTLADYALVTFLNYTEILQLPLAEYPEVQRWFANIQKLPAWSQTMQVLAHA